MFSISCGSFFYMKTKNITFSFLIFLILIVFSFSSFAEERGIFNFNQSQQSSTSSLKRPLQKLNFSLFGGYANSMGVNGDSFRGRFLPGIGLGYDILDNLAAELVFSYSNNMMSSSNNTFINGIKRFMISGDFKYKLLTYYHISPFIGLGLGYVSDKYTTLNIYTTPNFNLNQNDVSGNFMGGFEVDVTRNVTIGFRGKYHTFLTNRNRQYNYYPVGALNFTQTSIQNFAIRQDIMHYFGVLTLRLF